MHGGPLPPADICLVLYMFFYCFLFVFMVFYIKKLYKCYKMLSAHDKNNVGAKRGAIAPVSYLRIQSLSKK